MSPTAVAPDRLSTAREAARQSHAEYREHITDETLTCCTDGGRLCLIGQDLLEQADEDGDAWAWASRREMGR